MEAYYLMNCSPQILRRCVLLEFIGKETKVQEGKPISQSYIGNSKIEFESKSK